jgi:4-carboxymuconolactone decarboxylase
MPRATPIHDKSQVPAEAQHVAEDVIGVFGRIRGPFSVFLNSPKLADKMLALVKFNRNDCIVEPRLLSHAILASVRERDAHYVWAAQVNAARRAGVSEATIDLLRAKGDPAGLGEDERDIITYTRQLVRINWRAKLTMSRSSSGRCVTSPLARRMSIVAASTQAR